MTSTSIAQRAREAVQIKSGTVGFADLQRLLVRGGYLRANLVAALTEFDIIAGGLAWGIRHSRYTIDCEFVENASIRDKLKAAENICTALKEHMQCPQLLLPHQIQGLDYPVLAIVLHWLLQRVAMAREDADAIAAQYTSWDFARRFRIALPKASASSAFGAPGGLSHFNQTHQYWKNANLVRRQYLRNRNNNNNSNEQEQDREEDDSNLPVFAQRRPQRIMKSSQTPESYSSPLEHANAILLEYGDRYLLSTSSLKPLQQNNNNNTNTKQIISSSSPSTKENNNKVAVVELDAAEKQDLKQQREEEEKEKIMLEKLLSSMASHTEKSKVSSDGLGSVLAAVNKKRLAKLQRQFDDRMAALQSQLEEENAEKTRIEAKRVELAERTDEYAALEAKAKKCDDKLRRAKETVASATATRDGKEEELRKAKASCDKAEAKVRGRGAEIAALLDRAFDLQARIAATQEAIRVATDEGTDKLQQMKNEIAELTAELENLAAQQDNSGDGNGDDDEDPTAKALAKARGKFATLEAELSRLDMDILNKQRDIDSVLTRAEYAQYEQRLIELDEECACKFDETQLLVREQNLKVEILRAIANEDDVLSNIFESVQPHLGEAAVRAAAASKSKAAAKKESLQAVVAQVQGILKDIAALREGQERRLAAEQQKLSERRATYDSALAKQRAFRTTIDEVARQTEKLATLKRNLRELKDAVEVSKDDEETL
jgi:hypothetical protein